MSSRFVKITCAAALALPLAAVVMPAAHAETFPGENDCNGHFSGAVTRDPHQADGCYGIDQRAHRDRPSNDFYRGSTITVLGGQGTVGCNRGDILEKIFYTITPSPESQISFANLMSAAPLGTVTPTYNANGTPNSVSGDLGGATNATDGTSVTAGCRDSA